MKTETEALTVATQEIAPANLLQAIVQVASNPQVNIDVFERMMVIQERLEARQRESAFIADMVLLQAELPMITKGGTNKHTGNKYARLEDIHVQIQPLLKKYGFSQSFDEEAVDGDNTRYVSRVSHRLGHFEVRRLTLPTDHAAENKFGKAVRTPVQDKGATAAYAWRYLTKMQFSIVEVDADNDGNGPEPKITEDQIKDLQCKLDESKSNIPNFLRLIAGVERFSEIPARDFKRCMNAAEEKVRGVK